MGKVKKPKEPKMKKGVAVLFVCITLLLIVSSGFLVRQIIIATKFDPKSVSISANTSPFTELPTQTIEVTEPVEEPAPLYSRFRSGLISDVSTAVTVSGGFPVCDSEKLNSLMRECVDSLIKEASASLNGATGLVSVTYDMFYCGHDIFSVLYTVDATSTAGTTHRVYGAVYSYDRQAQLVIGDIFNVKKDYRTRLAELIRAEIVGSGALGAGYNSETVHELITADKLKLTDFVLDRDAIIVFYPAGTFGDFQTEKLEVRIELSYLEDYLTKSEDIGFVADTSDGE